MNTLVLSNPAFFVPVLALAMAGCDRPAQPSSTASSAPGVSPAAAPVSSAAERNTASAARAAGVPSAAPAPPGAVASATTATGGAPSFAPAAGAATTTFDAEPVGEPSPSFEGVVGDWYVSEAAGVRGLEVDGGRWRSGTPSANLADQAKRLYGDRYAEFLDGVKAFAFFPLAVWKNDPPPGDLSVSVRFYPLAGKVDQAAGIAFAIGEDGSYLGVRANALEENLLYFRVVKGKRTVIDDVRNVPTSTKTWHTLSLEIRGTHVVATVDGQKRFEKTLDHAPKGKIGLWSKADSQVLFDDFTVTPLTAAAR